MKYEHVLFVTDLGEDSHHVANKVKQILSDANEAKLSVIHVVLDNIIAGGYEIMPLFNYADDQENLKENAQNLKNFVQKNNLHADNTDVVPALSTAAGISDYASEHDVDLIVIGLHKKSGWINSLLGNTATAVLNNAQCDVMSVFIPTREDSN